MSTRIENGETYTNDGRTIRAVLGYNDTHGNVPTWVQWDTGLGWYAFRLIRATGSTWRLEYANREQAEVAPSKIRMRIG